MDKDMNSFERIVYMTYIFTLIITAMLLLAGCRQVRYVATSSQSTRIDESKGKDTFYVTKLVRERVVERVKDSTNVVVDENGNEKSRSRVMDRYLFIENRDSINYYRALYDSLRSIKTDTVQVPVPVERKLSRWQRVKMDMGGMAMGGFLLLLMVMVWRLARK